MEGGTLVIRVLAILLQFGALNADDLTQYARCHKNLTSSTGSVSEEEFSGLSCPEHEIRIQAGVPIVLTCQDLVLEVGSQQYCMSIGDTIKGQMSKDKPNGLGKPRMYNLDGNGNDSNNGGKRKHDSKPHVKSSVNSNAEDGNSPWKRRSKTAKALGKEQMAEKVTKETERTKGRVGDLKSNHNKKISTPMPSNRRRGNNKNKNKLDKLTSRLEKHTTKIGNLEKKITKLQGKPNSGKQVDKLKKKVDGLKAKSEVLQNKIDELQSLLATTSGLTNDTSGNGITYIVINNNQYGSSSDHADVNGDDSVAGDNDSDDIYYPNSSHDVSGHDSPGMESGAYGDDSYEYYGDYYYWPSKGTWPGPKNGDSKPKGKSLGKVSEKNFGKTRKGKGKGNGKEQSFCGPQDQPITINSQTGEIGLSVRPKGPKKGSKGEPSKPHHSGSGNSTRGVVTQGPAGAAVVMIPSEVKYTCSWSPASP